MSEIDTAIDQIVAEFGIVWAPAEAEAAFKKSFRDRLSYFANTARAEALEEAANLVEENRDWPLTGKTLKLAADIRALASSGGEKGEANG